MDENAVLELTDNQDVAIDSEGIMYLTAGSSSGSKYYDLVPRQQSYIANRWQQDVPTYSVIDVTETTLTLNAVSNQIVEDRRFFATTGTVNGYTVPAGSSFSTYTNISGAWEVDFQLFYTTYFRRIKTKLDLRTDYTYDHSPALIEGEKIFSDRHNPKVRLTFTSTVSKNHKIVLTSITSNTYNHSREYGTVDYFDQAVSLSSENKFAKRFFLNAMWTYQVRIPVVGSVKISSNVLNAVAGVYFTKNNRLSASISCYDILNRTNPYSSVAAQNYVRTSFSPFFGRYWAINLTWRFNSTE